MLNYLFSYPEKIIFKNIKNYPAQSIDIILKGFGGFWVWKTKLLTKNWKFRFNIKSNS